MGSYYAFIRSLIPSQRYPNTSRYELWYGTKFDFRTTPVLPFWSEVFAHTPAILQQKLGEHGRSTFYVGISPNARHARLYHDQYKVIIDRRSFKVIQSKGNASDQVALESFIQSTLPSDPTASSLPTPIPHTMSHPDPRPADVNFPDNGINVPDLVTNLSDPIQPTIIPTPVISNDSATTPPLNANQRKKRNLKATKASAKALNQDLDEMVRSCKWQDAQNELAGPPIPSGRKPKPIKPIKVKATIDWDPKLLFPNLKVKPPKPPKAKKPKPPPIDYILLKSTCDNVAQLNKFTQQLESLRPVADPIDDDDNNNINDIDSSFQ
jgi:hypothetical protein